MRKTAVIIVNPASGKGAALAKAGKACAILKKGGVKAGLFRTGGPGHGRELAKKFAATADVLVSVGGDGTLNEVVNGVIDARSGTPIAMVPAGTANVAARELGLPEDFVAQVELAAGGGVRRLDLGCSRTRCFMMCAGAGLDAAIVDTLSRRRSGRSIRMGSYVIPTLRTARCYPFPAVRVTVDGALVDASAAFVVVGNMGWYGGIFRLFKDASPEDGLLDVCCFHGKSIPELARYAWSAYWDRLHQSKGVSTYRGKQIRLEADDRVPLQIDGDPGGELPVSFTVLPKAVSFCAASPALSASRS